MIYEAKETCLVFFESYSEENRALSFMIFSFKFVMGLPFNLWSEAKSNQVMRNANNNIYINGRYFIKQNQSLFQFHFYSNFRDIIHT